MRVTTWVRALDHFVEACWLLALVAVPIYFDTLTVRIFEPDKIVLFRNIVMLMVLAVLLRAILTLPAALANRTASPSASAIGPGDGGTDVASRAPWWRAEILRRPLLVPVAVFVLVYTAATIHSVLPGISFWGSYDRSQGLYTWLNYIAFFLILSYQVRRWPQIERIISALVFGSIPVALYGVIQHFQWDPVAWGADTSTRVASTLGNSIFLGAYVIMCMPFAAYRLWQAVERLRADRWAAQTAAALATAGAPPTAGGRRTGAGAGTDGARGTQGQGQRRATPASRAGRQAQTNAGRRDTITIGANSPPIVPVIGYALILVLNFAALFWCGSRGPYYGLAAAALVIGFPLTIKFSNPYPAIASIALFIGVIGFPQGLNALQHIASPSGATAAGSSTTAQDAGHLTDITGISGATGTAEVRVFIWKGSIPLIEHSWLLGWGPETMIYVYAPYYPSGLGHIERSNAAPDRNHDLWLDFLVFSGVLGLAAWVAILGSVTAVLYRLLRRTASRRVTLLCAAIIAAVLAHLVEGSVGIPIVSTLMILWTLFAVLTAVYARPELRGADAARRVAVTGAADVPDALATQPREGVLVGAGAAGAAGIGGGGRAQGQQPRRAGGGNGAGPRGGSGQRPRQVARPATYGSSFERLTAGQQGGLLGLIVLLLVAIVGGGLLFTNNVQVVRADASYKAGQGYDNAASACLSQIQGALQQYGGAQQAMTQQNTCLGQTATNQQVLNYTGSTLLPQALSAFQDATVAQPNQDMYDLWMGKTYLDQATYDLIMQQVKPDQAAQYGADADIQFGNAEHTLMVAHGLNPYNADHPMNLARMYTIWASQHDPGKWLLADKYYKIATELARNNGRWADEWGRADLSQAARAGLTTAQRQQITAQALATFKRAQRADDLLGDAHAWAAQADLQLAGYNPVSAAGYNADAARESRLALQTGGFEAAQFVPPTGAGVSPTIIGGLVTALYNGHDYKGLATPFRFTAPNVTPPGMASPITLAISPTLGLQGPRSPYAATIASAQATLRQKGLLK